MPDVIPPVHDDPVDPENVTVICDRHRRKVAASPDGPAVVHVAGNITPPCDSERFLIRRETVVSRQDVLPVLAARAEAMAERRRELRCGSADHGSAGGAAARE